MSGRFGLQSRPRKRDGVAVRDLGDGGLAIVSERLEINVFNPTGILILPLLDGTRTVEDVVRRVCDEYDVTPEEATRDLLAFLDHLAGQGILDDGTTPTENVH